MASDFLTSLIGSVENEKLRTDFRFFIKKSFEYTNPKTDLIWNWHIDCISEYLLACIKYNQIRKLIINVSPRTTKSIICSQSLPAFCLGLEPAFKFIGISHSEDVALENSVKTRQLVESDWYKNTFPETILASDQNQKSRFDTTQNGYRIATTTGRGAAGKGADLIVADDYLNTKMALSMLERETALSDFGPNVVTRLNDKEKGIIIIIEQRLHDRDLTGKLIAENQGYTHLVLPAKFDERKTISFGNFHREVGEGELLDPIRLSQPILDDLKKSLGTDQFVGQFMQSPVAAGGNMIKLHWFRRIALEIMRLTKYDTKVVCLDSAYKADQLNDPSAMGCFGIKGEDFDLIDVVCERMEYPELKRRFKAFLDHHKPDYVLIEDKASGQSLIQELRQETGYSIIAIKPEGDKIMRLSNGSAIVEAGRMSLPDQADWLCDFENEVTKFPKAAHDDQVDMLSMFLNWFKNRVAEFEFFAVKI